MVKFHHVCDTPGGELYAKFIFIMSRDIFRKIYYIVRYSEKSESFSKDFEIQLYSWKY